MEQQRIFGNAISQEEREKLLEAHQVRKERTTFTQSLSDEELQIVSSEYIRGSIDLGRMEGEAKEIADEWKSKIKAKENELEEKLDMLKNGRREVTGVLYHVPNQAAGKMFIYNKLGELIEERPLKPEERQTRAFIEGPEGTVANPDDRDITDIEHEEVGTAEEQIEGMYQGPTIAGSAPAPGEEGQAPAEDGSAGFDYESRDFETQGSKAAAEEENGMAWDDPRQVRTEPDATPAVEGAKASRGRKKK